MSLQLVVYSADLNDKLITPAEAPDQSEPICMNVEDASHPSPEYTRGCEIISLQGGQRD